MWEAPGKCKQVAWTNRYRPREESSLSKYVSPIVLDEREAQLVVAEGENDALYAAIMMVEPILVFKITGTSNLQS